MDYNESVSKRLRREAAELRETAIDLMEHAMLLISKSIELEKQIERNAKAKEATRAIRTPRSPRHNARH